MEGGRVGVGGLSRERGREGEWGGKPRAFIHHQRIWAQALVDLAPRWGGVGWKGCRWDGGCEGYECDVVGRGGDAYRHRMPPFLGVDRTNETLPFSLSPPLASLPPSSPSISPGVNAFINAAPTRFSLFLSRFIPAGITSNRLPCFWCVFTGGRKRPSLCR